MASHEPTAAGVILAYALSAAATLLWAGVVLPAGVFADGTGGAPAVPMQRESWLLVGALLLLILGPVGVTLARGRAGHLGVLAATDAFVAFYAALGLTLHHAYAHVTSAGLTSGLYLLGLLSTVECGRVLWQGADARVAPRVRGLRLALCLLVLLMPSWFLVRGGQELASLLVPYAFVAVGAAGATMARTDVGLRLVSSVVHLALAVHVFVTVRYAIFEEAPRILRVNPVGWSTLGLAAGCLALALLQVLRRVRHLRAAHAAPEPEPA
jgi:hypothetical protein